MSRPYPYWFVALFLLIGIGFAEASSPVAKPKTSASGQPARVDIYGDALPPGAVARLGSLRLRHSGVQDFTFSPDGKLLISAGTDHFVRFWDVATGRPVRTTRLQGKPVYGCVAISPDGAYYAVTDPAKVHIWDTVTGKEVKLLDRPNRGQQVNYMYLSPDSKTLAVGSNFTNLTLWDWKTGKAREFTVPSQQPRGGGIFIGGGTSCQASFSPNSKLLATGTTPQDELAIWDVTAGKLIQSLDAHPLASAFSPDNKLVAVTSQSGGASSLRVYEVAGGNEVLHTALPNNAGGQYWWVTWSPDGKTILATDATGVYLIDRRTGKEVRRLRGPGASTQREVYFSPDGKLIAGMSSGTSRLRIWDAATGKDLHAELGTSGEADSAAYSPDGKYFATGSAGYGGLDVWDVATSRIVHPLEMPAGNHYVRHVSFIDGSRTLVAGLMDGTLEFYDVATGKLRRKVALNNVRKQRLQLSQVQDFLVLANGQRVLTLEWIYNPQPEYQISIWDTNPGRLVTSQVFSMRPNMMQNGVVYIGGMTAAAWTTFGDSIALQTSGGIALMDGRTGTSHLRIKGSLGGLLAASPDGRLLATAEKGQGGQVGGTVTMMIGGNIVQMDRSSAPQKSEGVHIWETATGKEITKLKMGPVNSMALAADNRTLLTTDSTAIHIWDLPTGKQRGQIPLPDSLGSTPGLSMLLSLHLSPDGRHLATPVRNGTVLIWELPQSARRAAHARLDDKELAHLWDTLAGTDTRQAYAAVWKLAEAPGPAVALLRQHLKPATEGDPKRVQKLVLDLDNKRFRVRESATHELARLGHAVEPELRKALTVSSSPEVRRRLQSILSQAADRPPAPETICHLRAVQVLEQLGTDEARTLLKSLARGVSTAPETRAAQAALDRLRHRQHS